MRVSGVQQNGRLANRSAIVTPLEGRSAVGGRELVDLQTTFLADGNLFYYVTVAPARDVEIYGPTFARVRQSIRLNDR